MPSAPLLLLTVLLATPLTAADLIDACDTTAHFHLWPGEVTTGSIRAVDGEVELRKDQPGDAFIRWSATPQRPTSLDAKHRWLMVRFGDFGGLATQGAVTVRFTGGAKPVNVALEPVSGPATVTADLEALAQAQAPGSTGFSLFIRHAKAPDGVVRIDEIRLGAQAPATTVP